MIHYNKVGGGPAVILVHGFPNDGSSWNEVVPHLSKDYCYIIPDLPGAGKSAYVPELTLGYMAEQLQQIMRYEGIDKAIFVGHSMGGYTIMEATQLFPQQIAGISLVHSSASADSEEKKAARLKSIKLLRNGPEGKRAFLRAMAQNLFAPDFLAKNPQAAEQIYENGFKLSADALAAFYQAIMLRSDKTEWTKQNTEIPMQWIIGDEDKASPLQEALQQCHLSQINDVQIYRGVGHMSMIEAPERLAQDLNNFFDYVWKQY